MVARRSFRGAFTLVEVVMVVAVLAIVAVFAVSRVSGIAPRAMIAVAEKDVLSAKSAFIDENAGYLADMQGIPGFSVGYLRMANILMSTNLYGEMETASGPVGVRVDGPSRISGCAMPSAFTTWSEERGRGWRGPYIKGNASSFPSEYETDGLGRTFGSRGFYPKVSNLRLPSDITSGLHDCSVYGFPGEAALDDPWGNPYVLQIPPPQAFAGSLADGVTNAALRFRYARIVSAGPDGVLDTPCFAANATNEYATSWNVRRRRLARQAGLIDTDDRSSRGDDIVLFLNRNDTDEGDD